MFISFHKNVPCAVCDSFGSLEYYTIPDESWRWHFTCWNESCNYFWGGTHSSYCVFVDWNRTSVLRIRKFIEWCERENANIE